MELARLGDITYIECIFRVLLSCVLGAVIGIERTRRQKEAGIRTHIIVALGSALMMIVSKYGFFDIVGHNNPSFSGDRIAANIITGISFLGAGMIFYRGSSIKGLTTAAGIWSTAGIGLAVGSGLYIIGISSCVLILIVQIIFHKWKISVDSHIFGTIVVEMENDEEKIEFIEKMLYKEEIHIETCRFKKTGEDTIRLTYTVRCERELSAKYASHLSRIIPEIKTVEVFNEI